MGMIINGHNYLVNPNNYKGYFLGGGEYDVWAFRMPVAWFVAAIVLWVLFTIVFPIPGVLFFFVCLLFSIIGMVFNADRGIAKSWNVWILKLVIEHFEYRIVETTVTEVDGSSTYEYSVQRRVRFPMGIERWRTVLTAPDEKTATQAVEHFFKAADNNHIVDATKRRERVTNKKVIKTY